MLKIFLAGKIPKGNEIKNNKDFAESIISNIKIKDVKFIKGEKRDLDESDFLLVFGWDCRHIRNSDIVIIDAREKIGAGTAQEMLIAKHFNGKTIDDWIHPFIYSTSDIIIESEKELGNAIKKVTNREVKIKDISIIDDSIKYLNEKLG